VAAAPEAPYIIEKTLIMSTMGLPVMLAMPVPLAGAGLVVVEAKLAGVGAAACAHGELGQSAMALIGSGCFRCICIG
jgi:hypothetical protein